jgi:hypothetical protein
MKPMLATKAVMPATLNFPYITCRNISAPEDEGASRKVYAGQAPATSVLDIEDDENVREYLVNARGKQKHTPTLVHQAIRKTLEDHPDQFSILNGGMVIVARKAEIDDKQRIITLTSPSIINGSQTQGELKRYFSQSGPDLLTFMPSIKYELIITDDDDLIAEISISRNFQNDVRAISIAGRRGQLDDLEQAVQIVIPDAKLRKSETDLTSDGEFLDTEKLIQVIFALMPSALLEILGNDGDVSSKGFTYSQKTRCLKLFQRVVENQNDKSYADVYQYFLNMGGHAWKLYETWKSHKGFRGTRLRSIEREAGEIVDVPDGIIFPILSALSAFVVKKKGQWVMQIPPLFDEQELIDAAKQAYTEIAAHNPQTMGKNKACYSTLHRITSIYARLNLGK